MNYVIGDIHGCNKTLNNLLEQLDLQEEDHLYFVGDLIDRGPTSKGVIETIQALSKRLKEVKCCRGNHEQLMFDSEKGEVEWQAWMRNGGDTTLKSYGITSIKDLPEDHLQFYKNMSYYIDHPMALIVHAGFNFTSDDPFADKHAMLWTRDHSCDLIKSDQRPVIHGHTPVPVVNTKEMIQSGKGDINIDNGCVYPDREGLGMMTAIRIEDMKLYTVKNQE